MMKCNETRTETQALDKRLEGKPDVALRLLADVEVPNRVFVDNLYFTGVDVVRCYEGRFVFSFNDREPIELKAGELIVIYPGHYVKIEALEERNRLVYCIIDGVDSERFFDDLGFFDCARGPTLPRLGAFLDVRRQVDACPHEKSERYSAALRLLTDVLVSQLNDLKSNGKTLLFEAAHRIQMNLKQGVVRLEPLCKELKISRSHLHRVFVNAGLSSPSAIIRREQLRYAIRLLRETILPLYEVMERAGFISQSHFSTFIKKRTGKTPNEIRNGAFVTAMVG